MITQHPILVKMDINTLEDLTRISEKFNVSRNQLINAAVSDFIACESYMTEEKFEKYILSNSTRPVHGLSCSQFYGIDSRYYPTKIEMI